LSPDVLSRRITLHRQSILIAVLSLVLFGGEGAASYITSYYSPKNRKRAFRKRTDYIILHTTEGPKKGSLQKVYERGEAHYLVDRSGRVYRIIHRKRVALHAGRSMWNGRTNLDECSLGIEVVGHHNRSITSSQCSALRRLIHDLQGIYKIPDDHVLTHSMVAYGAPNRWHRRSHRGRKRCGMIFAKKSVRRSLGLQKEPLYDPDVKAGRLAVADPYLGKALYGNAQDKKAASVRYSSGDANVISSARSAWDIARDRYRSAGTRYVFPDGTERRGNRIADWRNVPAGTRVLLGDDQRDNEFESVKEIRADRTALDIAGDEYDSKTTIYFLPCGKVKRGDELKKPELEKLPAGTKMLVGYVHGGYITAKRRAFDVCGKRWDFPSTFYRFPDGSIRSGANLDENAIPRNCLVFFRN